MKKAIVTIIAIAALFLSSGCVTSDPSGATGIGTDLVLRTSVQYGSIRYLSKYPEHLTAANQLVSQIDLALEENMEVTLGHLENIVVQSIRWDGMTPENKLLLSTLLSEIRYQVGLKIGEGVLDETDKVFAKQVLSWIKQAIVMAGV